MLRLRTVTDWAELWVEIQSRPTLVYVAWGTDRRRPVYVGITCDLQARIQVHRASTWWEQVRHIELEHYTNRRAAEEREADLIRRLAPLNNFAGRKRADGSVDDSTAIRAARALSLHLDGYSTRLIAVAVHASENLVREWRRAWRLVGVVPSIELHDLRPSRAESTVK